MKASIKFREEQKPLIRAKVPLSILGFPFQSGVVAGDSKELSLNLSTFFDSGPSFKLSYRPNNSFNPFGFVFKSGIGHFGSPISSSITMTAEFNFVGKQNPRFFLHFKPRIGDFTLKKSQSSDFVSKLKVSDEIANEDKVVGSGGYDLFSGDKFTSVLPSFDLPDSGVVKSYLSGMEVTARTSMPFRNLAVMNFRWGVRLPPAEAESLLMKSDGRGGISVKKFPILVMNKIRIEHVAGNDDKKEGEGNGNVAEACLDVRRQLEAIQMENGKLRKAVEDLGSELMKKDRREIINYSADRMSPEFKELHNNVKS